MTLTLSAPVRIAAICGLAFAVLLPGGLMFMGRGSGSSSAVEHPVPQVGPVGRHHAGELLAREASIEVRPKGRGRPRPFSLFARA